jgi:type II secretory pathway pseudopilin PulG
MKKFTQTEQGFVSIFVTMMLIIIVSLLVLAFAQVSRREQRQTLDTQLSSQAYYAAETGVNDAKAAIMNYLATNGNGDISRSSCTDNRRPFDALDNTQKLSADGSVAYTCVLIDGAPTAIPATVGKEPRVLPLQTDDNSALTSVTISWRALTATPSASTASCPAAAADLPAADTWQCPMGGLRVDLVPFAGPQGIDTLYNNNRVAFLMPSKNSSNGLIQYASQNGIVKAGSSCSSGACQVTFQNMTPSSLYYIRLSQLYLGSNVTITARSTSGIAHLTGAVAMVDSTGKAQDVLRRVVVAVPLQQASTGTPGSAINSGNSICKRFRVRAGYFATDQTNMGTNIAGGQGNPFCVTSAAGVITPGATALPGDKLSLANIS